MYMTIPLVFPSGVSSRALYRQESLSSSKESEFQLVHELSNIIPGTLLAVEVVGRTLVTISI